MEQTNLLATLPEDFLEVEILQRLLPEDFVSYCGTNRSNLRQCLNQPRLKYYLSNREYPHRYFQRMIIASSLYQINDLCRYLINNASVLGQTVDRRTIQYAFGYCCDNGNKKLAIFLASRFNEVEELAEEFYKLYPVRLRQFELLVGGEWQEDDNYIKLLEEIDKIHAWIGNLPMEFWCDVLVQRVSPLSIEKFLLANNYIVRFDWMYYLELELYSSYIRKGNKDDINHLISRKMGANTAQLLLANLPDNLLSSFESVIIQHINPNCAEFKTYDRERFLQYIGTTFENKGFLNIARDLRYAYFCLSPKDFIDIVDKIPNEAFSIKKKKKAMRRVADFAENDGFDKWAEIVREMVTDIK